MTQFRTIIAALSLAAVITSTMSAVEFDTSDYQLPNGTYYLINHPDGRHNPEGERLYGYVIHKFGDEGRVLFDFEHPDAEMKLRVKGKTIKIWGKAVARKKIAGEWQPTDTYKIKFKFKKGYQLNENGGGHDIEYHADGKNSGSIQNLTTKEKFKLVDKPNNKGISMTLGDGKNGRGGRAQEHLDSLASDPFLNFDYDCNGTQNTPYSGESWLIQDLIDPVIEDSDFLFLLVKDDPTPPGGGG